MCLSALPVRFKRRLQNKEVDAGNTVSLHCELTKPMAPVVWKKENVVLQASDKHEIRQEGTFAELLVYDVEAQDGGDYSCESRDEKTTATVQVKGKRNLSAFGDHLLAGAHLGDREGAGVTYSFSAAPTFVK